MKASNLRGALLEYLIRKLLINCGFSSVKSDGLYTFETGGLFFINGKGAAHDADVLMDPPIQMPFSYPTRLLFECKAYNSKTGLPIVRNALGLRYDINEFEIVTRDSILQRQNNQRAQYAIDNRNRYNYQVGVACTNEYTKPAIEFAANNKLPLLSLSWFLHQSIINLFDSIDPGYVRSVGEIKLEVVYDYLKDRSRDSDSIHSGARSFLEEDEIIGGILRGFDRILNRLFIGLLETGDMVFFLARSEQDGNYFYDVSRVNYYNARIHYLSGRLEQWELSIPVDEPERQNILFDFFIPPRIMSIWREYRTSRMAALDIKGEYFSRIFIFNREVSRELPFMVINIDQDWLQDSRRAEVDLSELDR